MTPDQKKAHEEMMEVLKKIELSLGRIARKMGADYTQDEMDRIVGLKNKI